jgi:predicted branched-subunit amino acid permease
MTLPSDFWTKPQPGGPEGIVAGAVIATAVWLYFFFPTYRKAKKTHDALVAIGLMIVLFAMLMGGILVGGVIGGLIGLHLGLPH